MNAMEGRGQGNQGTSSSSTSQGEVQATVGALQARIIFAVRATHGSTINSSMVAGDGSPTERMRLAPLRNALMLDSGAQVSAVPRQQIDEIHCNPGPSNVTGLKDISGEDIPRYGHVELNLRRGQDVVQVGAEVADIEHGIIATDAIVKRGRSVMHSPAGHWIVDGTLEPPSQTTAIKLRTHQANYYLEFDEILKQDETDQGASVAAVRRGYRARHPPEASQGTLQKTMGPESDEQMTLPRRALKSPGQPMHHLPYRPWCPECVEARGVDDPSPQTACLDELATPKVMFDIFFVGPDELAKRNKIVNGCFSLRDKERLLSSQELDQTIAVLTLIDCKTNAQGTLFANKELDEYKVNYIVAMLDHWGNTTVILQTDQEPATMSIAHAVRDRRAKSTIVRSSPAYSKQSAGHVEGANRLAASLLRTYKLKLERKIGRELRPSDPIVPFLVNSVGWMIKRFQPRSHGGSSYRLIFGRECSGEIAVMGEQLWYGLAARVSAGRGKWEARFARGIWVGKSEIDDTHLVMDLERGIQKVRTVRRMPVEFRWNKEMLQDIRFTPWKPTPGKSAQVVGRNMHITERMINAHGPTDSCRKCSTGQGNHSAECRQRFEKIQYDLLQEKLRQAPIIQEDCGEQTVVTPAPAASETEPGVTESSSTSSASERIRQKRSGLHGPEHPDVSEPVQTNVSSPDVAMENAVSPAPASSSGQSGPREAPVQERLKRVDTDEEMRTGESDVKKPRVCSHWSVNSV